MGLRFQSRRLPARSAEGELLHRDNLGAPVTVRRDLRQRRATRTAAAVSGT